MIKPNPYAIGNNIGLTSHASTAQVTMGYGAMKCLSSLKEGRIAFIVDAFMEKSPMLEELLNVTLADVEKKVLCAVSAEPSYEAIDPYIPLIKEYKPTHIIALGGGSTIDTAKALWTFYELPECGWEDITSNKPIPQFPGKATLIAIPTTSGTGAEATGAAVYKKYDGSKALIIDKMIRPNEVYLDFELVKSLPARVVATSGIDALAHVIGAMSVESINPMDKMICTQVAVTIINNLEESYKTGDAKAREAMHVSAYLAGDEIQNAGGGLDHKLDMFAKAYHIAHGDVIGMFLTHTMEYLIDEGHYTAIADQLGITGKDDREKQQKLIDRIVQLRKNIGIPHTIQEAGVPEDEFLKNLPSYIESVKAIGHIYWIKGFKGDDSLKDLYLKCYYGK